MLTYLLSESVEIDNILVTHSYTAQKLSPNTEYELVLKAVIGSYQSISITNSVTKYSVPVPEKFSASTKIESSVTPVWNNLDYEIAIFEISCPQSFSNCLLNNTTNVSQLREQINHLTPGAQYTFQI